MIYLDASIIIRLIEGVASVRDPIEMRLAQVRVNTPFLVTSRLSRLECRSKPLREQQQQLLDLYDAFFAGREVTIAEIGGDVIEKATEIRAASGLKAADAIHAATSILAGASAFWTTDQGFVRCPDLPIELFPAT